MAGDRLTRILAVWSADTLLKCEDSFYLPVFAFSLTHMCASHAACPLTVPVPHSCCAPAFAMPQHNAAQMAHFAQFDPPIPAQVAAIASAPLPTLLGCGLGVGSLLDVSHSRAHIALVFTPRVAGSPPSSFNFSACPYSQDAPNASQGPVPSNVDPTSMAVRRSSPQARHSYYWRAMENFEREPGLVHLGSCVSCGQATGNYCDTCVAAGRSFDVPSGLTLSGSPLCSTCEVEFHCYVCVGVVPPAIAGPPNVPLVTITVPPAPTA